MTHQLQSLARFATGFTRYVRPESECQDAEMMRLAGLRLLRSGVLRLGTAIRVMIGVMTKPVRLQVGKRGPRGLPTYSHDVSRLSVEGN